MIRYTVERLLPRGFTKRKWCQEHLAYRRSAVTDQKGLEEVTEEVADGWSATLT